MSEENPLNPFVWNQLKRLPASRKLQQRGDYAFITCPFHKGGKEENPSLRILVCEGTGYKPGSWICWVCGDKKGQWDALAKHIGLKVKGDGGVDEIWIEPPSKSVLDQFFKEDVFDNEKRRLAKLSPRIVESDKWRGIQGWLLKRLGARSVVDDIGPKMYLPVKLHKKWVGGIYCTWQKEELSYINEKQPTMRTTLFPHDYVAKRLAKLPRRKRILVLGEGPRDALNPLQNGILTLANLGGPSVWCQEKADQIIDLDLHALIIATDPDKAGKQLADKIRESLQEEVPRILRFKMHKALRDDNGKEIRKKEDPGNLSYQRMKYLKSCVRKLQLE